MKLETTIQDVFNSLSLLQKKVNDIEKSYDIIRTLSPQSVPVENTDKKLLREINLFNSTIRNSKQFLDKAYDICPYDDNNPICKLLSNCRYNMDFLIKISNNNVD